MIIYNTTWLANLRLQDKVKDDLDNGLLTAEEFKAIAAQYPVGFYMPNVFVRVGQAVLTLIVILFSDGLMALIASSSNIIDSWGFVMFLAGLSCVALELMTKQNNYYRAGVDDLLTLAAGSQIVIAFAMMYGGGAGFEIFISAIILLVSLWLTIRFGDMLMSAIVAGAFFGLIFFVWIKVMPLGLATAPFIMMAATGWLYWFAGRLAKDKKYINYKDSLFIMQAVSLLGLYAAGNYYVIQTLSADMAGKTGPVPFGFVFWAWTCLVPFAYIAFGIRKKDAMLMRIGLLLIAAAVATFRNYYHVLPVDVALTIGGSVILLVVFAVVRYLKIPKHGFTTADPEKANALDNLRVESLIVAQTFSHAPNGPVANNNDRFGGGSFGGGGSSAEY